MMTQYDPVIETQMNDLKSVGLKYGNVWIDGVTNNSALCLFYSWICPQFNAPVVLTENEKKMDAEHT